MTVSTGRGEAVHKIVRIGLERDEVGAGPSVVRGDMRQIARILHARTVVRSADGESRIALSWSDAGKRPTRGRGLGLVWFLPLGWAWPAAFFSGAGERPRSWRRIVEEITR